MARPQRTTLYEIARAANVSATTVSNVVNGRLNLMSEATRLRIEAMIREMNYRPNEGARNLRLSQRRTVGLIVVDDSPAFLADPMITNIVAGLSNYLGINGYGVLVTGITRAAVANTQMLRRDQTDAICVIPSGSPAGRKALYQHLREVGQPVLIFQDRAPDFLSDTLSVLQDDLRAGTLVAERLAGRGAQRIAFLAPVQNWPAMTLREQGVRQVATAAGMTVETVSCASEGLVDTQVALTRYVDRAGLPDAIIGGNDQMAIAALNWVLDRNLRVPQDVKIVGFNAFEFAGYVRPKLTTVRSPAYEMGRTAAEHLLRRFTDGVFQTGEIVLDVELLAGQSD